MINLKNILIAIGLGTMMLASARAQGTAFTYQGRLNTATGPATGIYDMQFVLSNAPSGGGQIGSPVTNLGLSVSNGLFVTTLNFSNAFNGQPAWLAISVRTNGAASYSGLTPLQPLTPTPYAIYAESASATNLVGTVPAASLSAAVVTNGASGLNLSGTFAGAGGGLTALNGSQITSGTVADARLSSNVALLNANNTFSGIQKVGTIFTVEPRPGNVGANNFFAGASAGVANTTGIQNTFVGVDAGFGNISGGGNSFYGFNAGTLTTVGNSETFMGNSAGYYNTVGDQNTFLGAGAGQSNTNGSFNTFIGTTAGLNNLSGSNNIALGYQAGINLTAGSSNIDIGNPGLAGDVNVIRIGSGQTSTLLAGSVGIGTSVPTESLTIANVAFYNSGLKLTGNNIVGTGMAIENTGTAGHKYDLLSSGPNANIGAGGFGIYDETAVAYRFNVSSNGNVGINTTLPAGHLSVGTANGTVNIMDGAFTPELVMTGGPADGALRLRNRLEVWPKTNITAAGYVDIRGTNGVANITLDGSIGQITATSLRAAGAGINTGTFAFIQQAVGTNTVGDQTIISNPVCDGDPNAILIVTHNWTADTNSASKYNSKPVGVFYSGLNWCIFNEDQSTMALGRAFNVMIIKP